MKTCMMCENKVTDTKFCSEVCMKLRIQQVFKNDQTHTRGFSQ